MQQITLIRKTLQPHLDWHGARLSFLALFLVALFRVKTVNLAELATGFAGKAQTASHYKRLQRFLGEFELNYFSLAKLVVRLMEIPQPWSLAIDRTTWELGGCCHNILMLGVVHKGVAFPLFWWMLDKKGNSNTTERIDLLGEFLLLFPQAEVEGLYADREFMGEEWFEYLLDHAKLPFGIRIRESDKLDNGRQCLKAKVVFASLQVGQQQVLSQPRRLWGRWVYVAALRLKDGKLLIVASNRKSQQTIAEYGKRWGIETLFGCFKSRGFCLESTHLFDSERLSRLIGLLTIGLCWAFKMGEWLAQAKPIEIKRHGRKAKSIFRYGLDQLRRIMLNLEDHQTELLQALHLLSST